MTTTPLTDSLIAAEYPADPKWLELAKMLEQQLARVTAERDALVATQAGLPWALTHEMRDVLAASVDRDEQDRKYVPDSEVIASCRAKLRSTPMGGSDGQEVAP